MRLIKEYLSDYNTPSEAELMKCIEILDKEPYTVIKLKWFFPYSGWYEVIIDNTMTLEEIQNRIPTVYGV